MITCTALLLVKNKKMQIVEALLVITVSHCRREGGKDGERGGIVL